MIIQIGAYPRSGTAWLTTMFNLSHEVMAYHELAMTDPNWKKTLNETEESGLIVFDIGTYQYFPNAVIPESKKLFLLKDPYDCLVRCQKATGGFPISMNSAQKWIDLANDWSAKWNPIVVDAHCLFMMDIVEQVWDRSLSEFGIVFPKQKVQQLLRLNIQLQKPKKELSNPELVTRLAELL